MKNILLYFALFILIILLFIPFVFRLIGKDWYANKSVKLIDTLETLNCNKANETVNLTFLNNKPHNLQYLIRGNYIKNDELADESIDTTQIENTMINDLYDIASKVYKDSDDVTEFKIDISSYEVIPSVLEKYVHKESASTYYAELGFSCTKNVLDN